MAYADYEFYTTSYFGSVVPEADFPRLAERASDFVDTMTFDRLVDGLPTNERSQKRIKKAVCSLAELMYQIELAEKNATNAAVSGTSTAILKKYGPDATDNAQLHVRYTVQNGGITITDKDGKILPWVPVKEWKRQINNALEDTITFSDESFFWEGEWTGGTVIDSDYRNGFYQYMNENKDNVFKITSVGGPYTLIPHFEILGK